MRILSIGEIIWDIFGDIEHLGGAPLNFGAHMRRLGHEVFLFSGVGEDARGPRAVIEASELGVAVDLVQRIPGLPTGFAAVENDAEGHPHFAIARPAAYDRLALTDEMLTRMADLQFDWIYFGTLFHTTPANLLHTRRILEACPTAYRVYDMNLRGEHWNPTLVRELASLASVVKASDAELQMFQPVVAVSRNDLDSAMDLGRLWGAPDALAVVITRGANGCMASSRGELVSSKGFDIEVADTVGAGDAFTAGFIHALSEQRPLGEAAEFANALGALVASRAGAIPEWTMAEIEALIETRGQQD